MLVALSFDGFDISFGIFKGEDPLEIFWLEDVGVSRKTMPFSLARLIIRAR